MGGIKMEQLEDECNILYRYFNCDINFGENKKE